MGRCEFGTNIYLYTAIFVKSEEDKLRFAFERDYNRDFANKYESCKDKCKDVEFEKFYATLIGPRDLHKKRPAPH